MHIGTKLPNGARVVALYSEGKEVVVLCEAPDSPWHPHVTWNVTPTGEAFWGHYFDNEMEAREDFYARCKRLRQRAA